MGDLDGLQVDPDRVVLTSGDSSLHIIPRLIGTVGVEFYPTRSTTFKSSYSVTRTDWPEIPFTVTDGDPVRIEAGDITVEVSRSPVRLSFYDEEGRLIVREDPDSPALAINDTRSIGFDVQPGEGFYGLGENSIGDSVGTNRRGSRFRIENDHQPPAYLIFPFFVSSAGYGVFVDNSGTGYIDLAATEADTVIYTSDVGELRYYVMSGGSMYGTLDQYTQLTGRPPVPPLWTLGNIQSRYGYESFSQVNGIIDEFRQRQIPLDGVILDLDWFGKETMGNLEFQTNGNWPDPEASLDAMRQRGVHVIPITEPQISGLSFNAPEVLSQRLVGFRENGEPYGIRLNWITGNSDIYLMDFTNPDSRAWWGEKHQRLLQTYRFDGFWQDLNEPEGQPEDMLYVGGSAAEVRNVIALQMNRSLFDAYQQYAPERRPFIMSRSGFPGMQKYGAGVWSGDVYASWYDLDRQKVLAASMGVAGVPYWNSDIGGFLGTPSPELYLRWCQFALFNPIYRPHADHDPREPWVFGAFVEEQVRELLLLRSRLLPYFYSVARQTHETGAPIMRPPVMDWPDDPVFRYLSDQYMYGDSFMVRPITTPGASEIQVYFPSSNGWFEFFSGMRLSEQEFQTFPVDLTTIPIYVKAPALIPLAPAMEHISQRPRDEMELRVYLDDRNPSASSEMYEDDGVTNDYLAGAYQITRFSVDRTAPSLWEVAINAVEGDYSGAVPERQWSVVVHGIGGVNAVAINDAEIQERPTAEVEDHFSASWHYDSTGQRLRVHLPRSRTSEGHMISIATAPQETGSAWIIR